MIGGFDEPKLASSVLFFDAGWRWLRSFWGKASCPIRGFGSPCGFCWWHLVKTVFVVPSNCRIISQLKATHFTSCSYEKHRDSIISIRLYHLERIDGSTPMYRFITSPYKSPANLGVAIAIYFPDGIYKPLNIRSFTLWKKERDPPFRTRSWPVGGKAPITEKRLGVPSQKLLWWHTHAFP